MAPNLSRQPAPILPPSPLNSRHQPQNVNQLRDGAIATPTTEGRMNPPHIPRSLMTPVRETREDPAASSSGGSGRKPRQNLEERDHLLMLKHCHEQRHNYKEGTKSQFWTGVNVAFQQDTGKVLAQMSATVARLVEARRRQIADWENGVIPHKPGGELNDSLDQWMEFLRTEDGEAEAERMRQVEVRRRLEETRKEARRAAIAAETIANPQGLLRPATSQQAPTADMGQINKSSEELVVPTNNQADMNGHNNARKRKRNTNTERQQARELQSQIKPQPQPEPTWAYAQQQQLQQQQLQQQQQQPQQQQLQQQPPIEPPKRVVIDNALTKEDWMEIVGSDARLRALENKIERIESICSQNNKLLLQLVQNQTKDHTDEERVPVHLDAEFERDYL